MSETHVHEWKLAPSTTHFIPSYSLYWVCHCGGYKNVKYKREDESSFTAWCF